MAFHHMARDQRRVLAKLSREMAAKRPARLTPIPDEEWPQADPRSKVPTACWWSRDYLVQLYAEKNGARRMSINRTTLGNDGHWLADLSWEELQRIKGECGFADACAVEIYPAERDTVNVANMRHLWLLPEPPAYGWRS